MAGVQILSAQQGQVTVTLGGIAKHEAKKPYTDYTTRARNSMTGEITATVPNADPDANFLFTGLPPAHYVVELLDKGGKVVCTEGPFDLTSQFLKNDVDIKCHHAPVAWWLIGAAAAAGVTAGVVSGPTSASR